jgi:indolepyruvate ferredoxin oxidoreductase
MAENLKPTPGGLSGDTPSNKRRLTGKPDFSLDAKYLQEDGVIVLSGVQALLRVPLDMRRADQRRGLNTATLVSGYRGSPLGGLDMLMQENKQILEQYHVTFLPGLNEDLAATAVMGSQLANTLPNPKYDGVMGMWYGKAPGVDRSGDAFKHANFAGVARYGGVLALAGDDPNAKSSTLPSATEQQLVDAFMPVLYPGSVQEMIDFGRWGYELSRYSGLWVGFKVVTNVADEFASVEVSPDRLTITDPGFTLHGKPWQPVQRPMLLTPYSLQTEREIIEGKLEAARAFGAANQLNRVAVRGPDDWIGIAAAGKTYYDVRQALKELGLDEDGLRHYGIRLLKIGLLYPIDDAVLREFASGLEEVFVIEEKRSFIESMLRDALYNLSERPRIVGKRDENDAPLVKAYGELDSDDIAALLYRRLTQRIPSEALHNRVAELATLPLPLTLPMVSSTARTPYYCSGCPHNTSTMTVPEGALVGAGIGCHTMTLLMDKSKDAISGLTQMGGEGVQWVGAAPFTETDHLYQNIGDGTLFHSGTLAIRQAVAANAHLTYKILWNSAVAMTGGQDPEVKMSVWQLTHLLRAEGVGKIIVTTPDPQAYPPTAQWAEGVEVWHRDRIEEAQLALREHRGVTILIHDQECAAELRRKRRRGLIEEPNLRVFINEAVCEGCGDCGEKSNCLSVFPVETEFGRKTQIHQSSCNKDYSCLKGDCPAFITVEPVAAELKRAKPLYEVDTPLPDPVYRTHGESNLYMMGIGGTGVVTVNQILGTAAVIDGKSVVALDQTGLSQKGGPVVSHIKIKDAIEEGANKVSRGKADGYLVFDELTGAQPIHLMHATPGQTVAVVSTSVVPTGQMIANSAVQYPGLGHLHKSIDAMTTPEANVYFNAIEVSEALFGSHMQANLMMVGAAFQRGLIPVSAEAIEQAITLNGVAVKANIQAFRVGRRIVIDPAWVSTLQTTRQGQLDDAPAPSLSAEARQLVESVGASGELRRLLEIRVPELIEYQNADYARQYVQFVQRVYQAEQQVAAGQTRLSEAVARYLFKFMAYKDEYEVARLHLKSAVREELREQFGPSAKTAVMLHPPLLRAMGLKRKLKLGAWFTPFLHLLRAMKGLRHTPLDIFGYDHVRRVERALIVEYRELIERYLPTLATDYELAVKLAELPDMVRGYDHVKLRNVAAYHDAIATLTRR